MPLGIIKTVKCTILYYIIFYQTVKAVVNLRGKGASFPNEVYKSWIPSYKAVRQAEVALNIDYESVGSGAGKRAIISNVDIEYAGSDSPLTGSDRVDYPDLVEFPTMAGAIVIGYNIPSLNCSDLRLTREQLVGIYNGTFTYWNETTFKKSNPDCYMISARIVVIARADKSGSTSIFTGALSSFDSNWASVYGKFSAGRDSTTLLPVHWNPSAISYFGEQTRGVSGLLLSFENSVTYLSVADALETNTNMALIENGEGNFTSATSEAVQNAMDYFASETSNLTFSLANSLGGNSYPIASFTHFFVYKTGMTNCASAKEFVRYVNWFLTETVPINSCKEVGMTPLSTTMIERIEENILKEMTCNGVNVWELVQADNVVPEPEEDRSWVVSVSISIPILFVLVLTLGGYIVYQKYKVWNILNSDEWNIPIEDIVFYYDSRNSSFQASRYVTEQSIKSFKSLSNITDCEDSSILLQQILQWPGKWNGNNIGLRLMEVKQLNIITLEMKKSMLWLRDKIIHPNVVRFYGLTEIENSRYVLGDYCSKGSLSDVLQDDKLNLNNDFKLSLTMDVALGMQFLHSQSIIHGNLRSSVCLIDNKWTVRISDWEYTTLLTKKEEESYPIYELRMNNTEDLGHHASMIRDFFVAPEILKSEMKCMPTKQSDVFSFAMVLQEIYTREDPYSEHADSLTPAEILDAVLMNNLRPQPHLDMPVYIRQITEIAWTDNIVSRPSFDQIIKMLKCSNPTRRTIIDSVMQSMEEYTNHLENRIEEKNSELVVATDKMEAAMSNLMPIPFMSSLSNDQKIGKTKMCNMLGIVSIEVDFNDESLQELSAAEQVACLTDLYSTVDCLAKPFCFFKYTVSGNGCTLVLGLSEEERSPESLGLYTAHLSMDIACECSSLKLHRPSSTQLKLRIGAHVGPALVGIIGSVVPRFVIFGPVIDVANALARSANSNNIHITRNMWKIIKQTEIFTSERAGLLTVKGIQHKTYWLTGRTEELVKEVPSESSHDSGVEGDCKQQNCSDAHNTKLETLKIEKETGTGSKQESETTKPIMLHKSSLNRNQSMKKKRSLNTLKQCNAKVFPEQLEIQVEMDS